MSQESEIERLLAPHSTEIRTIVQKLRRLMNEAAPGLVEEAKLGWKNLVYKGNGVVLAIMPYTKYVSLHFYKGVELHDPHSILEGGGKELRHVKIHHLDDINRTRLLPLISQAIDLDKSC